MNLPEPFMREGFPLGPHDQLECDVYTAEAMRAYAEEAVKTLEARYQELLGAAAR